jgi:adenine-specific DNA-methyltransferase
MSKTKLELTWIGKDKRPKLEPRILLEDPSLSYHAKHRVSDNDQFDNKLIFGDNLLALKALEQEYRGKVKCVFIDPPYNTGSAFTHYDDGLEHSIWLSLMRDRLEIIRSLLADDGSLWITIDDNEAHYLKVLCDEVFGRRNFVRNIVWQKKYTSANDAVGIPDSHDHILVYRKTDKFSRNLLPRTDKQNSLYKYDDNDGRGSWRTDNLSVKTYSEAYDYEIQNPKTGVIYRPPAGRCWQTSDERMQKLIAENRIFWGKGGNGAPQLKRYLAEVQQGVIPNSWWPHEDAGHNDESRKEQKVLFGQSAFSTPKPERLLEKIVFLATNPGDLILDSFAGSGTTGAVAHKMGRRWIMIELGEHCHTHIIPRLQKVVNGEDQGGISKAVNWQGGGGFRYYSLAPSLLEQDRWGNWVVNKNYNPAMLAEALCKLEGFTYAPSDAQWWNHGYSSERDFIYVTTQNLSHEQLQELVDEVGGDRSLLVCCAAFRGKADRFPNLTLKKIPKMVLSRCEWAHDDYSLNVANLPMAQAEPETDKPKKTNSKQANPGQNDLFADKS